MRVFERRGCVFYVPLSFRLFRVSQPCKSPSSRQGEREREGRDDGDDAADGGRRGVVVVFVMSEMDVARFAVAHIVTRHVASHV